MVFTGGVGANTWEADVDMRRLGGDGVVLGRVSGNATLLLSSGEVSGRWDEGLGDKVDMAAARGEEWKEFTDSLAVLRWVVMLPFVEERREEEECGCGCTDSLAVLRCVNVLFTRV